MLLVLVGAKGVYGVHAMACNDQRQDGLFNNVSKVTVELEKLRLQQARDPSFPDVTSAQT